MARTEVGAREVEALVHADLGLLPFDVAIPVSFDAALVTTREVEDLPGRLLLEAGVFVLLSMRDDFAAACHVHEALRPISHELRVLSTLSVARPSGAASQCRFDPPPRPLPAPASANQRSWTSAGELQTGARNPSSRGRRPRDN
jgi:hypothetical protein